MQPEAQARNLGLSNDLAVRRNYAGQGLGAGILPDALLRIAIASQSIGIGAVLVHAKDGQAKRFYMACAEFIEYPADSRTLFLPIETVIAAFSPGGSQDKPSKNYDPFGASADGGGYRNKGLRTGYGQYSSL